MKKSAYLLVIAAGLVLAGCGPTDVSSSSEGESTSSTGDASSSIEEGGSSSESSSSSEDSSSSESSSIPAPTVPEVLTTSEGLKSVFDTLMSKSVVSWTNEINGQTAYSTTKQTITREVTADEALTTTVDNSSSPAKTSASYYGLIGDVYYDVQVPNQASRRKVVEEGEADGTQSVTAEQVRETLDYQIAQNGLASLFDYWSFNAGDPWYGGNKQAATEIEVRAATADADGYSVTAAAYYEAPEDSYYQCYSYTGIFNFVDGEADEEGNPTYDLTDVIATTISCEVASWDYENHAVATGGTSYTGTVMASDIVYGEIPAADPEAPLLEDLDSYYVSGIEGTPVLEGQSGYDDLGAAVFQVGDTPSLSYDTVFSPTTALNGRSIELTGASDPEALAEPADSWSGYTFAKAGTFDLYFGDAIEPRLIVVEDVVVQDRGASIPLFPMTQFASTTANGATVTSNTDWSTMETTNTVTLPLGGDTVYLKINPETGSMDEVFDLTAISIDIDDPTIIDVTLGSEMQFDYDYYCWLLPVELDVKSAGTATVTFTSSGEGSMGMGTVNTAELVVTGIDGEAAFTWSSMQSTWGNAAYWNYMGSQIGLSEPPALPVEPTFDYEKAELSTAGTGEMSSVTISIFTAENQAEAYAADLLANAFYWPQAGAYVEYERSEAPSDGAAVTLNLPMVSTSVDIAYDAEVGCVTATWKMMAY